MPPTPTLISPLLIGESHLLLLLPDVTRGGRFKIKTSFTHWTLSLRQTLHRLNGATDLSELSVTRNRIAAFKQRISVELYQTVTRI